MARGLFQLILPEFLAVSIPFPLAGGVWVKRMGSTAVSCLSTCLLSVDKEITV